MIERLWNYLQLMFPVHRTVPVFMLGFAVSYCTAAAVIGTELVFEPRLLAGAFSFILFALLLRVMDEFKDYEIDKTLFPDRPLITGLVTRRDLTFLGLGVSILLFILNVWQEGTVVCMYLICFFYTLLMFKFFFWRKVREKLIFALITHNPVVFLFQCYVMSYHSTNIEATVQLADLVPVAVLLWLPWLGWEIARKIRAPESEDDYETYSRIFGYKGACGIIIGIGAAILVGAVWISGYYKGGWLLVAGMVVATCYLLFIFLKFAITPRKGKAPLRPVFENYLLFFYASFTAIQFFR